MDDEVEAFKAVREAAAAALAEAANAQFEAAQTFREALAEAVSEIPGYLEEKGVHPALVEMVYDARDLRYVYENHTRPPGVASGTPLMRREGGLFNPTRWAVVGFGYLMIDMPVPGCFVTTDGKLFTVDERNRIRDLLLVIDQHISAGQLTFRIGSSTFHLASGCITQYNSTPDGPGENGYNILGRLRSSVTKLLAG